MPRPSCTRVRSVRNKESMGSEPAARGLWSARRPQITTYEVRKLDGRDTLLHRQGWAHSYEYLTCSAPLSYGDPSEPGATSWTKISSHSVSFVLLWLFVTLLPSVMLGSRRRNFVRRSDDG
ncbi:hypothetical protein OBBRIDRAFT_562251 [Obba rivulosa]|uniref:Uncharacterized protein n=1 Tax=Obba rivulosa TaxID=1052685 RepID=A0A8E2DME5_9APHY|nr:hypothetical protein OBBRIDRAFT_562251 [Obba rivulosa]